MEEIRSNLFRELKLEQNHLRLNINLSFITNLYRLDREEVLFKIMLTFMASFLHS